MPPAMKYRELIQFAPMEGALRLPDAAQKEHAKRLVSTCLVSGEMAARLTSLVFPNLQLEPPVEPKALFVVGPYGTGKTHLLSFISALAEHADLAGAVTNPQVLAVEQAAQAKGHAGLEAIAGRFKVIRAEPSSASRSLREFIIDNIEDYLASQGIPRAFLSTAKTPGHKAAFREMMAAFHQKFPEHGLLLVVDELFEYLRARKHQQLLQDLDFLRELGELGQELKFRFIAGLQESIFDNPRFHVAAESLRRLKDRFEQVKITSRDVAFVLSERLVRKTPAQKAQVKEYLSKFAPCYSDMNSRMDEFVALFPIHPDYIEVFTRIAFAEKREIFSTLSSAVEELLDQKVPTDRPGLIAYDSYWPSLRNHPVFRSLHEIEAVIDCSKDLEEKIESSSIPSEHKHLAMRLVHALCIHRLTSEDIYSHFGPTPSELRDQLCLYQPGLEDIAGEPSLNLLSQVIAVLGEIQQIDGGKIIASNPQNHQVYLHLKRFKRFVKPELLLHWVNALPFVMLMLTGGIMLASRFTHFEPKWFSLTRVLHISLAAFWVCALPLSIILRLNVHWLHLRTMLDWGKDDLDWLVQSIRSLYSKKAAMSPVGRFNTGQKINACLVMLYFFGFGTTGIFMFAKGTILVPWYAHTALFFAALASVGGHLYLSLVHPGTRVSLPGIFHGWTPMEYIKHHHPLSLPKSLRSHVESAGTEQATYAPKVELIILAAVLLMAGFGVMTFQKGRLATVQKVFAKSFAGAITPNQLSTKHRLGPSAESCTKCHLYTGEIPDAKCEACHAPIKERRAQLVGYHGAFKGDCITCHKEHPTATNSVIPVAKMDRRNFNHDLAAFKLAGKHAKFDCDECHKKKHPPKPEGYYIGLNYQLCTGCHHDPHNGRLAAACDKCHSCNSWTGKEVTFAHNTDSTYCLDGKHEKVKCAKCHKPDPPRAPLGTAPFKGVTRECLGCHKDPHQGQFAAQCAPCHTPFGWKKKQLAFDHDKDSKYPLLAKHAQVACDKCHVPTRGKKLGSAKFRGMKTECVDCHKDPHQNQFAAQCTPCHTLVGWKKEQLAFDHTKDSKYPLLAKHAEVACDKCHVPATPGGKLASARFRAMKTECVDCHKDPHRGQFLQACTQCHNLVAWTAKQVQFDHNKDSKFGLVGKHISTECIKCHKPQTSGASLGTAPFKGVETACEPCHKVKHPETYGPLCVSCHAIELWQKKAPGVEHIQRDLCSGEHLSGKHLLIECRACHKESSIAAVGQVGKSEYQCHTCHNNTEDPHKGTLGLNCSPCHSQGGWKGEHVRFNHDTMTRYPLDQDHKKVACAKCHENNLWKPLNSTCQSCHPKKY